MTSGLGRTEPVVRFVDFPGRHLLFNRTTLSTTACAMPDRCRRSCGRPRAVGLGGVGDDGALYAKGGGVGEPCDVYADGGEEREACMGERCGGEGGGVSGGL